MKKYNKPNITVTTFVTVSNTNLKLELSAPIALGTDADRMDSGSFTINDLDLNS